MSLQPANPLFDNSREPKLNVSTKYDEPSFRELRNEYWLPNVGYLGFHQSSMAARDEGPDSPALESRSISSIFLSNVVLHTRTSYETFYAQFGGPPAQISFDRPALVLHEHEAENPQWREGMGVTTTSAAVCLPKVLRDGIGAELQAQPQNRCIVVGFPHRQFALPQPRTVPPNSAFIGRVWIVETDDVEIDVF